MRVRRKSTDTVNFCNIRQKSFTWASDIQRKEAIRATAALSALRLLSKKSFFSEFRHAKRFGMVRNG